MRVYMIKEKNELHLVPVAPGMEEVFKALYGQQVLVEGDNVPEVLRVFHELPVILCDGF